VLPFLPDREGLRSAWVEFAEALWPRLCHLCGAAGDDGAACAAHRLPARPRGARCDRCASALPPGLPDGGRCAACRRRAPGWSRLLVLGDYRQEAGLREWILAFKHGRRTDLARPLGAALHARAAAALARGDVLVPVPLHPLRHLERGYDQAALLAREIARQSGLPALGLLARARDTPPQGVLGPRSRTSNVAQAFEPSRAARRHPPAGRVWLVDDVVTSGATAAACARELRRLGATEVGVLALARAAAAVGGYPLGP
jgi:ComF family protein